MQTQQKCERISKQLHVCKCYKNKAYWGAMVRTLDHANKFKMIKFILTVLSECSFKLDSKIA